MSDIRRFNLKPAFSPCILALGTFDGVHLGHSLLIENTLRLADSLGMSAGAFFFKIPPAAYFSKDFQGILTDTSERLEIFEKIGLDFAIAADFEEFRNISADSFIKDTLIDSYNCRGAVCGYNYTFGAMALGTPEMLSAVFKNNFICLPQFKKDGQTVSSTEIRRLISLGLIEKANSLIGREYGFTSKVIKGRQDGRKLGFPTVNQLLPENKLMPAGGVFASKVKLCDGHEYYGVTDVGFAPTLTDSRKTVFETHILNFSGDLYEQEIKLSLCARIRDEKKFSDLNSLICQINEDIKFTERYFSANDQTP